MSTTTGKKAVKEDVWIPSVCNMCFNGCGIKVHRVDGVVVKIEGNPDSPVGCGRICGKGASGIMQLYDPNRVTKPLKRTNPKKGRDQDPGWVEISWDEAYTLATEKIKEQLARDPRRLMAYSSITNNANMHPFFDLFTGCTGCQLACPGICGAALHMFYELYNGHGNSGPDYPMCKYVLQFGTQAGTATRHGFNMSVDRFAEARANGCKLVSVDPHMSAGPEKADLWVPIRPGTDGALAMGIAYVLVHELGIYDRDFLKTFTNAPYLVDAKTGLFVRHPESKTPYIWDSAAGKAKLVTEAELGDPALTGRFKVNGADCLPGFELYMEKLKDYTPEKVEKITTVPPAITRQVAKEFGEAASIGTTITLDGKTYPYRPVCSDTFSGMARHSNAFVSMAAVFALNTLVGAQNVPGGLISFGAIAKGNPATGLPAWKPGTFEQDQMLESVQLHWGTAKSFYEQYKRPIKFQEGDDLSLLSLQPMNTENDPFITFVSQLDPETYHQNPAETLVVYAGNPLKNWGNFDEMEKFLRTFKYMIMVDIYLNDSSYFADLILPEAAYLERLDMIPNAAFVHHTPGAIGSPWGIQIRQPAIQARDNCPGSMEIFFELAKRLGVLPRYLGILSYQLQLTGERALDAKKHDTWEKALDQMYRGWAGPDKGLDWFKKNGVFTWPRSVDELYLYPHNTKARIPLYMEQIVDFKPKVMAEVEKYGLPWHMEGYQPLPGWTPCHDYEVHKEGFDLFPVYYTSAINVDTWGQTNPWINEINQKDQFGYTIEINSATARAKGLKSGDRVRLEASSGAHVEGVLMEVEGIHPEVLGVGGGGWDVRSQFLPVGNREGTAIVNLCQVGDIKRYDTVTSAYDQCVRVKVTKIG